MGLLGRIGKNVGQQFPETWGGRAPLDGMVPSALLGAAGGGIGAAAMPGDPTAGGMAAGAGMGAAAGAAIPFSVAAKRIVMAVAKAMKQQAPDQADDMLMQQAAKFTQSAQSNPDARAQIERIIGPINWDQ